MAAPRQHPELDIDDVLEAIALALRVLAEGVATLEEMLSTSTRD
jgi:hypothetical protein